MSSTELAPPDWSAFYGQLRRFVTLRVRDASDADDLVQVILERALSKQPRDGEIENIAAWLFAIARNAVFDHHRAQRRSLATDSIEDGREPESNGPTEAREREEVLACMQPLLAALPEDARQLLRWADVEGRPLQSIADELGISLTATKSRVQRARKAFVDTTRRCCFITLDARGRVRELSPRRPNCSDPCDPNACSKKS